MAEIEKGQREPVMYVGNLNARRDFTDVRDVVEAYGLLAEYGQPGETYNVGKGEAVSIEEILEMIIGLSNKKIKVEIDLLPQSVSQLLEYAHTPLQILSATPLVYNIIREPHPKHLHCP